MKKIMLIWVIAFLLVATIGIASAACVVTVGDPQADTPNKGTITIGVSLAACGIGAPTMPTTNLTFYYSYNGEKLWARATTVVAITSNTTCSSGVCANTTASQEGYGVTLDTTAFEDAMNFTIIVGLNSTSEGVNSSARNITIDNNAPSCTVVWDKSKYEQQLKDIQSDTIVFTDASSDYYRGTYQTRTLEVTRPSGSSYTTSTNSTTGLIIQRGDQRTTGTWKITGTVYDIARNYATCEDSMIIFADDDEEYMIPEEEREITARRNLYLLFGIGGAAVVAVLLVLMKRKKKR